MKFNEFKNLVTTRHMLLKEIETLTDKNKEIEIQNKIDEIEEKISTDGKLDSKLFWVFRVDTTQLCNEIVKYFKSINIKKIDVCQDSYNRLILMLKNSIYGLGLYADEISLKALYTKGYTADWDELFERYPDLKEHLWEFVKDCCQANKKHEVSLIQKMIKENENKIANLKDEEYIKNTIVNLEKENEYNLQKIETINADIDEITL